MSHVSAWPAYHYTAEVRRIIDGDSIEVLLSMGDRTYRVRRIRILGFNSPELFSGDDREAGELARDALRDLLPIGSRVYIETKLDRTSFDRLLGIVYVEGSDGNLYKVSEAMIAGGFGVTA
jgi:endonuclease YncB( thermonuclease family)